MSLETDARMPDYIPWKFHEGYLPPGTISNKVGTTVPYQKPELVDEFIHPVKNQAVLIFRYQIDHCAGRGMQFAWEGILLVQEIDAKRIYYDAVYMIEIKEGRRVDCNAIELYKQTITNKEN